MKTHAEIYQALIDGKTFVNERGYEAKLIDGKLDSNWAFPFPEVWSIKEETKMYCRFKKLTYSGVVSFTTYTEVGNTVYHSYLNSDWIECEHITFEERK